MLELRYGLDGDELSLRQVGERLGLSGERVRQLERRALAKLGAAMGAEPATTGPPSGASLAAPAV